MRNIHCAKFLESRNRQHKHNLLRTKQGRHEMESRWKVFWLLFAVNLKTVGHILFLLELLESLTCAAWAQMRGGATPSTHLKGKKRCAQIYMQARKSTWWSVSDSWLPESATTLRCSGPFQVSTLLVCEKDPHFHVSLSLSAYSSSSVCLVCMSTWVVCSVCARAPTFPRDSDSLHTSTVALPTVDSECLLRLHLPLFCL